MEQASVASFKLVLFCLLLTGTRGGFLNATTFPSHTSYYFTVSASFLEESLDRFADLFRAPLLKPDSADKELLAVESEFINGYNNIYIYIYIYI